MFRRSLLVGLVALLLSATGLAGTGHAGVRHPTLRLGDRGAAVVLVQQQLADLRYWDLGELDGVFGPATHHAVVAFQKVQGIARDGVVGAETWARLDEPLRPVPRYDLRRRAVEVDLTRQVLYVTRAGVVRGIVDISTGSGQLYWSNGTWNRAVTPTGRFRVYASYLGWRQSPLGWMYRPHFFYKGYAVHGSSSVPPYPASHGCVRVTVATMDRLAARLTIGMRFAVYA